MQTTKLATLLVVVSALSGLAVPLWAQEDPCYRTSVPAAYRMGEFDRNMFLNNLQEKAQNEPGAVRDRAETLASRKVCLRVTGEIITTEVWNPWVVWIRDAEGRIWTVKESEDTEGEQATRSMQLLAKCGPVGAVSVSGEFGGTEYFSHPERFTRIYRPNFTVPAVQFPNGPLTVVIRNPAYGKMGADVESLRPSTEYVKQATHWIESHADEYSACAANVDSARIDVARRVSAMKQCASGHCPEEYRDKAFEPAAVQRQLDDDARSMTRELPDSLKEFCSKPPKLKTVKKYKQYCGPQNGAPSAWH